MKVLFVLPRMVMGGVERVTLNLIRQFQADGIECALALSRCHGELLEEAMQLTDVHEVAGKGIHQFIPGLAKLMRIWRPTHVVVVFANIGLLTLFARGWTRSDAPMVYGVHNSHGVETARPGVLGFLRYLVNRIVARVVYSHADAIVADSEGVEREIRALFGVQGNRLQTIYNPVISAADSQKISDLPARIASATTRLVTIGRFVRQKGFDLLIEAMAKVGKQHHWRLDIYGDGPDRAALEAQIQESQMSGRIALKGYTTDPLRCLCEDDIFVLPSRHEGLPTVLIQALACGIQIVATDCQHGPSEILSDGNFGVLVRANDSSALADGITRVLSGQFHIDPAALRARAQDFSVRNSAARWRGLLEGLLAKS
jgi:glycosyltransferase involved in cell wall biosynthesis